MAADQIHDPSGIQPRPPVADGQIRLFDSGMPGERANEPRHRLFALGDDDESARILVQPVHDTGTRHAADAREGRAVVEERVHERAREMSGRRMHHHPGRLVHDQHIRVFVDDRERYRLRFGYRRHGGRNLNLYRILFRNLQARFRRGRAVYLDEPRLHEPF